MSHFISLAEAVDMTTKFRQNRENVLQAMYQNQNILPIAETFERAAFDQVLSQEGCTKLRIYYGMDETYKMHAIIVGVDANNKDMLPQANQLTETEEDYEIIERGFRCPDICGDSSDLNP